MPINIQSESPNVNNMKSKSKVNCTSAVQFFSPNKKQEFYVKYTFK